MSKNLAYGLKPTAHEVRGFPNWKRGDKKARFGSKASNLKCPSCEWRYSSVIDSRIRSHYQYRCHACPKCGTRFFTHEYVEVNHIPVVAPFPDWKRSPLLIEWRQNVAAVIEGTML